jgi:hypothetical protein
MTNTTDRWILLYRGEIYSETETYETRDAALDAVAAHNATENGFTCLRVPYRMVVCEGCRSTLLDRIYEVGARHLVEIEWRYCPEHDESKHHNEQTPMVAFWAYGDRGY